MGYQHISAYPSFVKIDEGESIAFAIEGKHLGEECVTLSSADATLEIFTSSSQVIEGMVHPVPGKSDFSVFMNAYPVGPVAELYWSDSILPPPSRVRSVTCDGQTVGEGQYIMRNVTPGSSFKVIVEGDNVGFGNLIVTDNRIVVTRDLNLLNKVVFTVSRPSTVTDKDIEFMVRLDDTAVFLGY